MSEQIVNPIELASYIAPLQKWEFVDKTNEDCQLVEKRDGTYRVLEITWNPSADAVYLSMHLYLDMILHDEARLFLLDLLNIFNNMCSYGSWMLDMSGHTKQTYTTITWKDEINTDISELTPEGLTTATTNAFDVFNEFVYGIYAIIENAEVKRDEDGAHIVTRFTTTKTAALNFVMCSNMYGHA